MESHDEPLLPPRTTDRTPGDGEVQESLEVRIKHLVDTQRFAVLCTQGEGQPYGSLVAYSVTDDLTSAVFATPKATRKFRLLSQCDHVALVIDNRPEFPDELMQIEGVTATGRAVLVVDEAERARWSELLVRRHPYMSRFVRSDSCGLFRIEIVRYFHVCRFQEVRQWIPTALG